MRKQPPFVWFVRFVDHFLPYPTNVSSSFTHLANAPGSPCSTRVQTLR